MDQLHFNTYIFYIFLQFSAVKKHTNPYSFFSFLTERTNQGENKVKPLKLITITSILFTFFLSLTIEARIWKDKKGHEIEAELMSMQAGKVFLKRSNGKTLRISKKSLSEADQEFLATKIPPKVKIDFKKSQDRRSDGYDVYMTGKIIITKKSAPTYSGTLTATLIMIGKYENRAAFIILDKASNTFTFTNSKTFVLKGKLFRMYNSYYSSYGQKYMGYIALITDADGKLVEVKSNRKEFLKDYKKIIKFEKGARFDRKFKATII